jgi:hypothetical protein
MERPQEQSLLLHGVNDRTCEAQTGSASALIEFACECGEVSGWETMSLSAPGYAALRAANSGAPLLAPKHDYARRSGWTTLGLERHLTSARHDV